MLRVGLLVAFAISTSLQTTGALASAFPGLSRFAVMKHLGVLQEAGLVLVRPRGRDKELGGQQVTGYGRSRRGRRRCGPGVRKSGCTFSHWQRNAS